MPSSRHWTRRTYGESRSTTSATCSSARRSAVLEAGDLTPMAAFELQFQAREIGALAERFGYTDDARLLAAGALARARGHYTREEFLEVCAWKTQRSRSRVASNTEIAVTAATGAALASKDEATRMSALLGLAGVGVPTASTLLYAAFPDEYPILDVRALESLGVRPRSQYPVSFWLEYLQVCRELARRHGVSVRTLDKALWQHSKERPDKSREGVVSTRHRRAGTTVSTKPVTTS